MMQLRSLAEVVAAGCCGLFSGAALYVSFVEHPARMECGTELASTEFAPSYRRGAILQALLAIVGALAAVLTWLQGGGAAWLAGGVLFVSVVPYTLLVVLPTNKQLLDASLDRGSKRAHELLVQWGRLHAVRTVVSLAAFILFLQLIVTTGK